MAAGASSPTAPSSNELARFDSNVDFDDVSFFENVTACHLLTIEDVSAPYSSELEILDPPTRSARPPPAG